MSTIDLQKTARLLAAAIFFTAFAGGVQAAGTMVDQPSEKCQYVNLATVPVQLKDLYPVVQAKYDNKEVSLVLGTGSELSTFSIDDKTAKSLLADGSTVSSNGAEGAPRSILRRIASVNFGDMQANHFQALLRVDEKPKMPFDGMLGGDILFSRDLEMSLGKGEIKFFTPLHCDNAFLAYWDDNASAIDMAKISWLDHRPVVQVRVNGKPLRAVIDSSTRISVIGQEAAARIGITPSSPGVQVIQGDPYGDGSKAWTVALDSFQIGEETIGHPRIRVADYWQHIKPVSDRLTDQDETRRLYADMVLGVDFLRAHRVLFAASQQRMYFSYLGGKVFADQAEQSLTDYAQPVLQINISCAMKVDIIGATGCFERADKDSGFPIQVGRAAAAP